MRGGVRGGASGNIRALPYVSWKNVENTETLCYRCTLISFMFNKSTPVFKNWCLPVSMYAKYNLYSLCRCFSWLFVRGCQHAVLCLLLRSLLPDARHWGAPYVQARPVQPVPLLPGRRAPGVGVWAWGGRDTGLHCGGWLGRHTTGRQCHVARSRQDVPYLVWRRPVLHRVHVSW